MDMVRRLSAALRERYRPGPYANRRGRAKRIGNLQADEEVQRLVDRLVEVAPT